MVYTSSDNKGILSFEFPSANNKRLNFSTIFITSFEQLIKKNVHQEEENAILISYRNNVLIKSLTLPNNNGIYSKTC